VPRSAHDLLTPIFLRIFVDFSFARTYPLLADLNFVRPRTAPNIALIKFEDKSEQGWGCD
jgi:hypothetical protein